ncbi:hypothetical protein HK098_005765 [Nowakowskiella sp. JEL0407]|nr:hypothetical protein HK098_005765 [Nowakowskiella sp. JEL0407]
MQNSLNSSSPESTSTTVSNTQSTSLNSQPIEFEDTFPTLVDTESPASSSNSSQSLKRPAPELEVIDLTSDDSEVPAPSSSISHPQPDEPQLESEDDDVIFVSETKRPRIETTPSNILIQGSVDNVYFGDLRSSLASLIPSLFSSPPITRRISSPPLPTPVKTYIPHRSPSPANKAKFECPICLSTASSTTQLMATKCGHVYCKNCLDAVFANAKEQKKVPVCPNCRTNLKSKMSVHPLFLGS